MKLYGVVGWKDTGKTGLVTRLVAYFTKVGLTVSTLKHTHHGVNLDPGPSDTARHRAAGAGQVILASDTRLALLEEGNVPQTPEALMARLDPVDLVIAEGWKAGTHPRLEAYRAASIQAPIAAIDPMIRALASDTQNVGGQVTCPVFDLDDTGAIATFIAQELHL